MNSISFADCRGGLERLMEEFAAAYSDETPIHHQRLSGLPDQPFSKQVWEDFRIANQRRFETHKKNEWELLVPHPNGLICSRFTGVGDQVRLDLFHKLANTGIAFLREASLGAEPYWTFEPQIADMIELPPTSDTYLSWLELLHLTAKECRTLFLHVDVGNWNHKANPYESVEQVAGAMSEPTPFGIGAFPLYPIVEDLQHDVFRSSVEAIKVWIGATEVVRVGKWPVRPPVFVASLDKEEPERSAMISPSHEVAVAEETVEESSPPDPTKLVIDEESRMVSYGGISEPWDNLKPYKILKSLNKHIKHGAEISDLRLEAWENNSTISDESIERQVCNLRDELKEKGYKGITIPKKPVGGKYKLILTDPQNSE